MFASLRSSKLVTASKIVQRARSPLILTGAGISVASGVPTFRGPGGLWKNRDFIKYAFGGYANTNKEEVFAVFETVRKRLGLAEPNAAHHGVKSYQSWVQAQGGTPILFTQNIDGLHTKAGSTSIELHGCISRLRCTKCNYRVDAQNQSRTCPACDADLRHDVVLFDEELPHHDDLVNAVAQCDCILLIGTSGTVTNTASMAKWAAKHSIPVIEINPALISPTIRWATVTIRQPAENVIPELFSAM